MCPPVYTGPLSSFRTSTHQYSASRTTLTSWISVPRRWYVHSQYALSEGHGGGSLDLESRALALRAMLLGLALSVFSLHLQFYFPFFSSFCGPREADLQGGIKCYFDLWLPVESRVSERWRKVRLEHFIHVTSGAPGQASCLNPSSQLLTGNHFHPALFVCGFW